MRITNLLDLNGRDFYTLFQSFLGVLILGGIGTGKTSAVCRNAMIAKLLAGYGGLFLCVKAECRELYLRWCEEAGRLDDVIVFSADSNHTFNFLDYVSKLQRDMQLVMEDVLFCLTSIMDALARKGAHEDRFFREAALSVYRAILTVLYIAEGKLELGSIYRMLTSLPRSLSERDPESNYCLKMLQEAWRLAEGTPLEAEMRRVMSYLLDFWPSLAVETRESIRASALMVIAELCHDPLFTRFGTTTTVSPDDILDHGKIVIVDWPTHESPRSGLVALVLWKVMFQRATLAKRGK
jgi:hypothetical protein